MGVSMRAQLVDLRRPGQLAEGVPDEHARRDLVAEHVAAVGNDRRHAGADAVAFDEGDDARRAPRRRR